MRINEASEDYLEAILRLEEKNIQVRMSDIAIHLGVSKPSVNKAMNILKDAGYITQQKYGSILLTEKGRSYAQKVYQRHQLFMNFFVNVLKIDPIIAEEDACHMEHCISDETMQKLDVFLKEMIEKSGKE